MRLINEGSVDTEQGRVYHGARVFGEDCWYNWVVLPIGGVNDLDDPRIETFRLAAGGCWFGPACDYGAGWFFADVPFVAKSSKTRTIIKQRCGHDI